jgi:hypothetical protein
MVEGGKGCSPFLLTSPPMYFEMTTLYWSPSFLHEQTKSETYWLCHIFTSQFKGWQF